MERFLLFKDEGAGAPPTSNITKAECTSSPRLGETCVKRKAEIRGGYVRLVQASSDRGKAWGNAVLRRGQVRKTIEDNAKRRLTEPFEIRTVIDLLRERGCPNEDLPILMTRYFYVDLDTFNDVMKSV